MLNAVNLRPSLVRRGSLVAGLGQQFDSIGLIFGLLSTFVKTVNGLKTLMKSKRECRLAVSPEVEKKKGAQLRAFSR
jgi:hypothetical protein